jgi:hypothetical protein
MAVPVAEAQFTVKIADSARWLRYAASATRARSTGVVTTG